MVKHTILYFVLCFSFISCKDDESSSGSSESITLTCKNTGNDHSGCCSHHGGFDNCQSSSSSYLYDQHGRLNCKDGTASPSCTW